MASYLNSLSEPEARLALSRCCGSQHWVKRMLAGWPFADDRSLFTAAEREWWALGHDDWLEAFAAHPRIGEPTADDWSQREQGGMERAGSDLRLALREENRNYERRFGHVYLVCATGRTASGLLADLQRRLANDPDKERRVAAGEQAKITRLRLERLVTA